MVSFDEARVGGAPLLGGGCGNDDDDDDDDDDEGDSGSDGSGRGPRLGDRGAGGRSRTCAVGAVLDGA